MCLQNTVISEQYKYISSLCASGDLIGAVKSKWLFSTSDCIREFKGDSCDKKIEGDTAKEAKLKEIVSDQGAYEKRLLRCAKHTGSCLSVQGTMVTSTVLFTMESCGFYALVTMLTSQISKNIDGYVQIFLVRHLMSCSNYGLVIARNNKIRYDITHLIK